MDISEVTSLVSDALKTIRFLPDKNIIRKEHYYCKNACSLVGDVTKSDKYVWQCKTRRKRYSIHEDSYFFKSKLTLQVLVIILYFFSYSSTITQCCKFWKKSSKVSIIQWYDYYRDIMTTWLSRNPVIFENVTVHVDESAVGGHCKYQRGRIPKVKTRWLFGITDNVNHKLHVEFIDKHDHEMLIPIITHHCRPGVTINSNGAKVYRRLDHMNYIHNVVIHKNCFVDPLTKIHMNWIENFPANLKSVLKAVRGSQGSMLDSHIDKYIYRYNRKKDGDLFNLMLNDIATLYPVWILQNFYCNWFLACLKNTQKCMFKSYLYVCTNFYFMFLNKILTEKYLFFISNRNLTKI